MKRDLDLIRELLLWLEQNTSPGKDMSIFLDRRVPDDAAYKTWSNAQVYEHLSLLDEAGFIKCFGADEGNIGTVIVCRVTWEGHDYLESIRDDTVWARVKSRIASASVGLTIEVVKAVATAIAAETLGLSR